MGKSATGGSTTRRARRVGSASKARAASEARQSSANTGPQRATSAPGTHKNPGTAKPSDEITMKMMKSIQRACGKDIARIITSAIEAGIRYRITTKGVLFYGDNGRTANIHFSNSDHRAYQNILSDFRKMGYDLKAA